MDLKPLPEVRWVCKRCGQRNGMNEYCLWCTAPNPDPLPESGACNCRYPEVRYRNGSGHASTCPVQKKWVETLREKGDKG